MDISKYLEVFKSRKMAVMLLLGFSSGLPLALTSGTLQAWLTVEGVDLKTIGLFSLIGIPYTVKFLWSPFMDRFVPPFLDRRRGWIALCQIVLALTIGLIGFQDPKNAALSVAMLALFTAFASASQDIVIDAYRTDVLESRERGLGSAIFVTGYRIGMLISGAFAMILSDHIGWHHTYLVMACIMGLNILSTLFASRPSQAVSPPKDLQDAVIGPLRDFFGRRSALMFLLAIILYKLGDAYAGTLTTAFLIRGAGFTASEVGAINKGFGLFALILGAMAGGAIMVRMRLFHALLIFGIFQALSNLSFILVDLYGRHYGFMIFAIAFENFTGGMGTSAFVALLMSLCNARYSATQYALLSSLASLGRVFIAPTSGYVVSVTGWSMFFFITFLTAVPGLLLIYSIRGAIEKLSDKL